MDLDKLVIPSAFAVGQLIDNRYLVVGHTPVHEPDAVNPVIGFGGMGNVYRCEDQKLPRTVALKTLSPTLLSKVPASQRDDFVQRFTREFRVVAQLNHPCIMAAYDCGVVQTDDGPYPYHVGPFNPKSYTAAWVVSEVRAGRSPLSREETRGVLMDIAAGIHHIHQAGWVLRDLKPPNIILEPDDALGSPRARLIDFGVAKKLDNDEPTVVTQTGMVMGTDPYLPPEVLRGAQADVRSDLWAFGITMYELLFGKRPFRASDQEVLHALIQKSPPVWPCQIDDNIEALLGLDHVFRMLVEKSPEDRCPSAKIAYEALRDLDELPAYGGPNAHATKSADGKDGTAAVHMMVMPSLEVREPEAAARSAAPGAAQPTIPEPKAPADAPLAPPAAADEPIGLSDADEEPERLPRKTKLTALVAIAAGLLALGGVALSMTKKQAPAVPAQISTATVERPHKPIDGDQLLAEEKQVRRQQLLASTGARAAGASPSPLAPRQSAPAQLTPETPGGAMLASRQIQVDQKPKRMRLPTSAATPVTKPSLEEEEPLPSIMGSYSFRAAEKPAEGTVKAAKAPRASRDLCAAELQLAWTSNTPNAPIIATLTEDCGDVPRGSRLRGDSPSFRVQGNVAYVSVTFLKLMLPGNGGSHDVQALAYEQDNTPGLVVQLDAQQELYAAEVKDTQLDIAEEVAKLSPLRSPQRIINEKRREAARLRAEHLSVPLPKGRGLRVLFMEDA